MAEPDEPRRFEPTAPRYLPRLWKEAPPPVEPPEPESLPSKKRKRREAEAEAKKSKVKATKKKKKSSDFDDGTGASKLEETPVLDTYETRQRIRWVIGSVLGAFGLIGLVLALRAFRTSNPVEPAPAPEVAEARPIPPTKPPLDQGANVLLETARQADKAGRTKLAVETLTKIAKDFQGTAASKIAMDALGRQGRSLPLFGVSPMDQATGPKLPPEPKQAKSASISLAPTPVAPGGAMPLAIAPNPPKESVGTAATPGTTPTGVKVEAVVLAKPLPSGYHAKPGAAIHPSGWPTQIICDRDNALMLLVPGAVFLMGRDDGEASERPSHRVKLSTYYIDAHEITVAQYQQYLGESGRGQANKADSPNTDLPVVNITAREAKAYCNWANRRLPTEAQWELAARSVDGRVSYWNGEPPRKDPAKGPRTMEPVMSLSSDVSPYGAYDLGGNAWEWTQDWYDAKFYDQAPPLLTDPAGPSQSRIKPAQVAVRGCSKRGILTEREGVRIEGKLPYLGFRGALPVDLPPAAGTNPNANPAVPNAPNGGEIPF